jgi:hypothetical protein
MLVFLRLGQGRELTIIPQGRSFGWPRGRHVEIEPDGHTVVDGHADDGVDAIDVEEVGEQEQGHRPLLVDRPYGTDESDETPTTAAPRRPRPPGSRT